MSILIKGMEMPISCPDCPMSLNMFFCKAREYRPITGGNGIELTDDHAIQVSRPDWCPLVEVPEEMP